MKILIRNQQRLRSLNKEQISRTAEKILTILKQPRAELSILFVGDKKMLQLNSSYRGVRKSTDVLSFDSQIPVSQTGRDHVIGDVVINVYRAEHQAETSGTGFYDEVSRLLVHGTLHLLGYDHEDTKYRALKMKKKEEELLNAVTKVASEHELRD
jgi:probable rRNA maturation factor